MRVMMAFRLFSSAERMASSRWSGSVVAASCLDAMSIADLNASWAVTANFSIHI